MSRDCHAQKASWEGDYMFSIESVIGGFRPHCERRTLPALHSISLTMTGRELAKDVSCGRPHVVILGAGASAAALPDGDRYGNKVPLMPDLTEALGLASILYENGIQYRGNFEEVYSSLSKDQKCGNLVEEINARVHHYFSRLALPSYPTIYDHLVLSLRAKDLIATFNWDPFLYRACWRNYKKAKLPRVVYLHGNVAVGYCLPCMQKGKADTECPKCGNIYAPSRLLFPIGQKDYTKDPFIKNEWEALRWHLKQAYMLTIFGYSAPRSDAEAIQLMKDALGSPYNRNLEQTEIIDIKKPEVLRSQWEEFIHSHHYDVMDNFYDSSIALFPRRTCEAQWNSTMECRSLEQNPVPRDLDFENLWKWFDILIQEEKRF